VRIAILGCGPAGLMAAHAAATICKQWHVSVSIDILSHKQKSPLYGAQYLHRPIPGIECGDPVNVEYRLRGTADEYKRKVYGRLWDGTVSPEDLAEDHAAWDIRRTYGMLWDKWQHFVRDTDIDPAGVKFLQESHDIVISSVPRDAICHAGHKFRHTQITAAGDAPSLGIDLAQSGFRCMENTVLCNGEDSPSWYRMSRVFGHTTIEWPADVGRVPITTAAAVRKPTDHDCDCHPDVLHVGRYGEWKKGVLSHTAYFNTLDEVERRLTGAESQGA
jgi:hypothetical protein